MISPPISTSTSTLPGRHCAVEFHALPSRIGQVRRIISAQLRYWRLDPLIDAAALGVTELLANVHRHANTGTGSNGSGNGNGNGDKHCTVEIAFVWDRLTVSVHDHDPRLPSVRSRPGDGTGARPGDGMATSGRGLALVAAVSDSWGMRAQHDGSGKTVWFSLPAVASAPRRRPAPVPNAGAGADVGMGAGAYQAAGGTAAAAPVAGQPRAASAV